MNKYEFKQQSNGTWSVFNIRGYEIQDGFDTESQARQFIKETWG